MKKLFILAIVNIFNILYRLWSLLFCLKRGGTMNRLFVVLITVVLALSALCDYGHAGESRLRCGTRLVALGMRSDEVLALCGEPSWANSWQETIERGTLLNKKDFVRATLS